MQCNILVLYSSDIISGGSFYDTFEYFLYLHEAGLDVKYMIISIEPIDKIKSILHSKYILDDDIFNDVIFEPFVERYKRHKIRQIGKNFPEHKKYKISHIICNTIFTTSDYSLYDAFFVNKLLISHKKCIIIHDAPTNSKQYQYTKKFKTAITLADPRVYTDYDIPYKRRLYLSKHKCYTSYPNAICLNFYTPHKRWPVDILQDIMNKYNKNIFIYTTPELVNYYDVDKSKITVKQAPIFDFHSHFDSIVYLNSNRQFDSSPRLIVECLYMNKQVYIYDKESLISQNDGGYFRYLDCKNNFDSLIFNTCDPILDIVS